MNTSNTFRLIIVPCVFSMFFITSPLHTVAAGEYVTISAKTPAGAINPGTAVNFSANASGFIDPVYAVADAFSATSATVGTIDKIGYFTWTPGIYDAGTHAFTITVTDSLNHAASTTTSILVASNMLLIKDLVPGSAVTARKTITFSLVAPGFVMPQYSVYDSNFSSSANSSAVSSAGLFSWTPSLDDIGDHRLTLSVSDWYGHSAQATQNITVLPEPLATTTATATATTSTTATSPAPAVSPTVTNVTSSPTATPTASAKKYLFTTMLAVGSRGAAVTELQKRLTTLGYFTGTATGYFGPATAASVKKYQKAQGLAQVGFTGPATRAALNNK